MCLRCNVVQMLFWWYPGSRASISSLSSLFDVFFSVRQFRSKILALPGFGNFLLSMHKVFMTTQIYFNQSSLPLTGYKECMFERYVHGYMEWNASSFICSKDLYNGMHDGMLLANWKPCQKRINLSNQLKSTGSLESGPSFWIRHFKRSVKPRQSWLTRTTDGNIKKWKCRRRRLL